jgi:hypothetical protein
VYIYDRKKKYQKADMENEGENAKQINRPERKGLMKINNLISFSILVTKRWMSTELYFYSKSLSTTIKLLDRWERNLSCFEKEDDIWIDEESLI